MPQRTEAAEDEDEREDEDAAATHQ